MVELGWPALVLTLMMKDIKMKFLARIIFSFVLLFDMRKEATGKHVFAGNNLRIAFSFNNKKNKK